MSEVNCFGMGPLAVFIQIILACEQHNDMLGKGQSNTHHVLLQFLDSSADATNIVFFSLNCIWKLSGSKH